MAENDIQLNLLEGEPSGSRQDDTSDPPASKVVKPTFTNRFSIISAVAFFGSAIAIMFAVAFLAFFWLSPKSNSFWQKVMISDFFNQTVTLLSTIIRFGITIQMGLCLSMAAAIALEKYLVPHSVVPSVSVMRIGGAGTVATLADFLFPLIFRGRGFSMQVFSLTSLTLGILFTSTALQFTSTLLLFDTSETLLPSRVWENYTAIDYSWYEYHRQYSYPSSFGPKTTWNSDAPKSFPPPVEYYEPPGRTPENASDTGKLLRALLPLSAGQFSRLVNYTGKALVMDQRVVCGQPELTGINWLSEDPVEPMYTGYVAPSFAFPDMHEVGLRPFYVFTRAIVQEKGEDIFGNEIDVVWTVIHQLQNFAIYNSNHSSYFSGSLYSELRERSANRTGAAYLIFRPGQKRGGEYEAPGREWVSIPNPEEYGGLIGVYATLCYTALDTADRNITASLDKSRFLDGREMIEPTWEYQNYTYQYDRVINRLLATLSRDYAQQEIFTMSPINDWKQPASDADDADGPIAQGPNSLYQIPFIPNSIQMRHFDRESLTNGADSPFAGNFTVALSFYSQKYHSSLHGLQPGQPWMANLFDQIFEKRDVSHALQGLLHSLAINLFYNQLSSFNKHELIRIYSKELHLIPSSRYGGVPIFVIFVCSTLFLHHIFVFIFFMKFCTECQMSRLGDSWQAIAQVALSREGNTQTALNTAARVDVHRDAAVEEMDMACALQCMGIDRHPDGIVVIGPRQ
ncbi:hypothetical protein ABW19_dt0204593 [Dactylella cylindrospora]|nr:hypothetical protein ABW19_dt0204593 [Dactylella cylindrospora]